jgi:hypothetical protein
MKTAVAFLMVILVSKPVLACSNLAATVARTIASVTAVVPTQVCLPSDAIKKEAGTPEKQMAQMMSSLSDEEVFIRLILAETLASGCPSEKVAEGIAWVLKNRVDANKPKLFGTNRGVVFHDFQFRSSTGSCDVAHRETFLCPSREPDFEAKYEMARRAYAKTKDNKVKNPMKDATMYFFFKHFDESIDCAKWKGVLPAWAVDEKREKAFDPNPECMGFYR